MFRLLFYVWAFPGTLLGILFVPGALWWGGSVRVVDGVLEVEGGLVCRVLQLGLPWSGPAAALTLGHVVLGCDTGCLEKCRRHERVHVRQYECWGPFFIPCYLLATFLTWLGGGHPYLDNYFEREAVEKSQHD